MAKATRKIDTPLMKAEAADKIYINKENTRSGGSLDSDLIANGFRSVQNDVKLFLKDHLDDDKKSQVPDNVMEELIEACLEYTQIDRPEDKQLLRKSLGRSLIWNAEDELLYYDFKKTVIKNSGSILTDFLSKKYTEGERQLRRELFSEAPSDRHRQAVLQFAYLSQMTPEEMDIYLTKWVFSDKIRWDDPWELAAAYVLQCEPAHEEDRAGDFYDRVNQLVEIKNTEKKDQYLRFIHEKEQQEFACWIKSYEDHCARGQREAFLCHWSWLLLAARQTEDRETVIPNMSAELMARELPVIYQSLDDCPDSNALRREIIEVMKNRQLRLVAAAYVYAMWGDKPELSAVINEKLHYTPPVPELGFYDLPEYLHDLENKLRPGGNKNRPQRSDVLSLGITLALTVDGVNHLLSIGGFYELYARDFFEYALLRALFELERSELYADGFRFGAKSGVVLRQDTDIRNSYTAIKETFLACLEENYGQLNEKNRDVCQQWEPEWILNAIRCVESE